MDLFLQQWCVERPAPQGRSRHPAGGASAPFPDQTFVDTVELNFPLRVAAIDVGSNAMRCLVAELSEDLHPRTLDYTRAPVRLGHDVFSSGSLSTQVMDAAIVALADFRKRMDSLGVDRYRAVATSAVRDSRNGPWFVQRVWDQCRIRLEPISGGEEARLVWLAVRHRVPLGDRQWILVDLGGGSVEISLIDAERIHWSESEPLGTVRLLQEARGSMERLRRAVQSQVALSKLTGVTSGRRAAGVIATGGNIEALAALAGNGSESRDVRRLSLEHLRRVLSELAVLSAETRMQRFGLRRDRADVIVPAAMVYERIARMAGAEEIVVPAVGLKDGVVLDAIDDLLTQKVR